MRKMAEESVASSESFLSTENPIRIKSPSSSMKLDLREFAIFGYSFDMSSAIMGREMRPSLTEKITIPSAPLFTAMSRSFVRERPASGTPRSWSAYEGSMMPISSKPTSVVETTVCFSSVISDFPLRLSIVTCLSYQSFGSLCEKQSVKNTA